MKNIPSARCSELFKRVKKVYYSCKTVFFTLLTGETLTGEGRRWSTVPPPSLHTLGPSPASKTQWGGRGRGHIARSPVLREVNPWQVHGRQSRSKHPAPSQLWSGQGSEAACSRPAPLQDRDHPTVAPPPPSQKPHLKP